jgi:hypothetical protein
MSKIYSPKIITDSLVMCLDPSQNKSYPTDLPVKNGLNLWLDAADDATFSYSSGTSVSQWRDKSGLNNHSSQATVGSQPSRSTTQNSRKTVNFDGTNDTVTIPNFICNSEMSIFVVSNCGTTLMIEHSSDVGPSGNGFYISGIGTAMFLVARNSASSYLFLTNWLSGGYSIASGVNSTGLDLLTYKNGSQQSPTTDSRISISNSYVTSTLYIGSRGANSLWSSGPIAEIIIYNRKVSNAERNLIHTYLGQKWGISNTDRSIVDLSGNDDNGLFGNGTVANMPDYDFYNKGALIFNGTSDYAYQSLFANAITTILSFDVWVKFSDTGSSGRYIMSLGRDIGPTTGGIALLAYGFSSASSGQIIFEFGSGYGRVSSGIVPTTGIWYNLTVTADGTNTRFYVNSVLANTASQTTGAVASSPGLSIGSYLNGATPPIPGTYFFNGNIGSVKIYTKTLSAAEVLQNYESQKSKFANTIVQQGLVLNLDAGNIYSYAGAGTTWIDVSGAVNDFAIVGSPTYSTNEFILNGTTQFFSLFTAASGFFINNTNNFYADVGYAWSISVWFKFPVSPTSVRDTTINAGNCSYCMFGNGGGIGGAETLALFVSGVSGTYAGVHPYYCMVGLRGGKTQLSIDPVNTNVWNNVVVTWDGTASRGYFNGVDRGALTSAGQGMQVNGYTIGSQAGGSSNHHFEGSISQTFVYSRAISASEVLQNYNALKGRFGL